MITSDTIYNFFILFSFHENAPLLPHQDIAKKRCRICILITGYVVIAVISIIFLLTSIMIIDALAPMHTTYEYVLLSTNATQILLIDSKKYDAVEIEFVSFYPEQTITISPVSGKITETVDAQFNLQTDLSLSDGNLFLTRYWPKGLAVAGTVQCHTDTSGEETQLVWKWSSIYKSQQQMQEIDYSIDCSKIHEYAGESLCPNEGTNSVDVETILRNRDSNVVMTLGVCNSGGDTYDDIFVELSAEFREMMYDTENYAQYSMGPNSNNPNSITIPLNNKHDQTNLYMKVTGTSTVTDSIQVNVKSIAYLKKDYGWEITSVTFMLIQCLFFVFYVPFLVYAMYKFYKEYQ